ncbi:MAG: TolB family protein [Ignavibacteria bacterium]
MKQFAVIFLFFISTIFSQSKNLNVSADDPYRFPEEKHLKNIRMLTNGGENAEAYLSFDETKLVFQSTRDDLSCDQIFIMNIDGTEQKLVSTGFGRTTCAYFLPGDTLILYASTHHYNKDCPPPPDRTKGYVWKLYDTFDLFLADIKGNIIRQLTCEYGYDAEATVSPKGDKIVFTSTRDGDPELYTMNLDGSDLKRITYEKGYDGGAFFSWDGSKIVFRASRPKTEKELKDYEELAKYGYVRPTNLEIYVCDADGSNIRQVTNNGAANFAPFFHPDGKRIIFCSNVNSKDKRNFDLYIFNIDGTGLEQVTFNETFDGFPMFTHDGKKLIFCSNRFNSKPGETNVFIADWVD